MKRKSKEEKIHLTDHFTYQIIDNIIYLYEEPKASEEELKVLFKKVSILIEDKDISYINISSKNLEERKEYYLDLGFSLSYYSIDKLNNLYKGYRNKKDYRCYAVMTKKDFLNINNKEDNKEIIRAEIVKENTSNKGFISSMFLLFTGIAFLCYLAAEGAITLIKIGR